MKSLSTFLLNACEPYEDTANAHIEAKGCELPIQGTKFYIFYKVKKWSMLITQENFF